MHPTAPLLRSEGCGVAGALLLFGSAAATLVLGANARAMLGDVQQCNRRRTGELEDESSPLVEEWPEAVEVEAAGGAGAEETPAVVSDDAAAATSTAEKDHHDSSSGSDTAQQYTRDQQQQHKGGYGKAASAGVGATPNGGGRRWARVQVLAFESDASVV